jgi:hypothetical protein
MRYCDDVVSSFSAQSVRCLEVSIEMPQVQPLRNRRQLVHQDLRARIRNHLEQSFPIERVHKDSLSSLRAELGQFFPRSGTSRNLMPRGHQPWNELSSQRTRGAQDENAHKQQPPRR